MTIKFLRNVGTANFSADTAYSLSSGGPNDTTHPVDGDTLNCDANSGTTVLTVDVSSDATGIDFTGFTGTFTGSAALQIKAGGLKAVSGMTYSYTGTITVANTSGTCTLTSAGKTLCGNLTQNGAGGTTTIGDDLHVSTAFKLLAGTFTQGTHNILVGTYETSGTGVRVMNWDTTGTGTFDIDGSGTVVTVTGGNISTNATYQAICRLTYAGASARTLNVAFQGLSAPSQYAVIMPFVRVTGGTGTVQWRDPSFTNYGPVCCGMDWTGYAGVATFGVGGGDQSGGYIVDGDVKYSSGMTIPNVRGPIWVGNSANTRYLYTVGNTLPGPVYVTGGGTYALGDNVRVTSSILTDNATWGHLTGTFDFNDMSPTIASFSASASDTRTIDLGSGTISLTSSGTIWNMATTTGLTLITGTATIKSTYTSTSARTITANSVALPNLWIAAGSGTLTLTNVNCLDYSESGFSGTHANTTFTWRGNLTLGASATYTAGANAWTWAGTGTGTWTVTANGKTIDNPLTINGATSAAVLQHADAFRHGATRTLTFSGGTWDWGTGLTHMLGFVSSTGSATRVIASGTSTCNFPTTGTVWTQAGASGLTVTGTGTIKLTDSSATGKTISGGGLTVPGVWMSAGSATLTFTSVAALSGSLDFTGATNPTWAGGSGALSIGGSLTYISGMTQSYTGNLTFNATATGKTITTAGKTLTSGTVTFNGCGGGWTLQDNVSATGGWSVLQGSLDTNGKNFSTPSLLFNGALVRTLTLGVSVGSITGTGTVIDASGTNQTLSAASSTLDITDGSNTQKVIYRGVKTFGIIKTKKIGTNRVRFADAGTMNYQHAA